MRASSRSSRACARLLAGLLVVPASFVATITFAAPPAPSTTAKTAAPPAASSVATKPASAPVAPGTTAKPVAAASPAPKSSSAPTAVPAKPKTPSAAPAKASAPKASVPRSRKVDAQGRRLVAAGPTNDDALLGAETAELRSLHEAEREIFPVAAPAPGLRWPDDLSPPVALRSSATRVHATGLPRTPRDTPPSKSEAGKDLTWLSRLTMPDIPVRWDARVVRYLEFWKDDPRGRALLTFWLKKSGKYKERIRRTLRAKSLPEDLLWVALAESGFDASARSPVGAVGLWQFMPDTARLYGLNVDRWLDERHSAEASTEAAADFLSDLYRRFGSWELVLASYNMGYGGVMASVRKYNSNDFWSLSHVEAGLPWETTLYVPKIVSLAVVGKNLATFGFADLALEPALEFDTVHVAPGTSLHLVAQAANVPAKDVDALNPELRAGRVPPDTGDGSPPYAVRVPAGKGELALRNLEKQKPVGLVYEKVVVRLGESLESIAQTRKTSVARILELNALSSADSVRSGTVLLVPKVTTARADASASSKTSSTPDSATRPVVVVPKDTFSYPGKKRMFYRVGVGDSLREVATAFSVEVDEICRWNDLEPSARLQDGMTLQVFADEERCKKNVAYVDEEDVEVLTVGSEPFFAHFEALKGRKRITVTAKPGETLESIGRRHGLSVGMMERINRRGRGETLSPGETLIVYAPSDPKLAAPRGAGGRVSSR